MQRQRNVGVSLPSTTLSFTLTSFTTIKTTKHSLHQANLNDIKGFKDFKLRREHEVTFHGLTFKVDLDGKQHEFNLRLANIVKPIAVRFGQLREFMMETRFMELDIDCDDDSYVPFTDDVLKFYTQFRETAREDYLKAPPHNGPDSKKFIVDNTNRWNSLDRTSRLEVGWGTTLAGPQGIVWMNDYMENMLPGPEDTEKTIDSVTTLIGDLRSSEMMHFVAGDCDANAMNLQEQIGRLAVNKAVDLAKIKADKFLKKCLPKMANFLTAVDPSGDIVLGGGAVSVLLDQAETYLKAGSLTEDFMHQFTAYEFVLEPNEKAKVAAFWASGAISKGAPKPADDASSSKKPKRGAKADGTSQTKRQKTAARSQMAMDELMSVLTS